jgi:Concanavalin A-like lectin/glucanases superfamily
MRSRSRGHCGVDRGNSYTIARKAQESQTVTNRLVFAMLFVIALGLNAIADATDIPLLPQYGIFPAPAAVPAVGTATPVPTPSPTLTPYQPVVLSDSPWAYWRLNQASGNATDLGSGANNLTVTGSPAFSAGDLISDPTSNSIAFSGGGTDFFVKGGPLAAYPTSNQITVEMWVQPSASDLGATYKHAALISNADPLTNTNQSWWSIEINGDATTGHFTGNWNGSGLGDSSPANSITAGNAYLVDMQYDHATGNRWLYVNGVAVVTVVAGSVAFGGPFPAGTNTTPPIMLGCQPSTSTANACNGFWDHSAISEVAIYPTILSPTRILAHYNAR